MMLKDIKDIKEHYTELSGHRVSWIKFASFKDFNAQLSTEKHKQKGH